MGARSLCAVILLIFLMLVVSPLCAFADTPAKVDSGDTAFVLISAALVMLMTPGLALFYGGMVRGKNVLGRSCRVLIAIAVISVQWILFGYSLAFGPDIHALSEARLGRSNGVGATLIQIMLRPFRILPS